MDERRWPSRNGADDEAGAPNEVTRGAVARAAALVRERRVYDLSHVLDSAIPAFPGRGVNWIVEQVAATSQMGTHMDELNHLQIGERTTTVTGWRAALDLDCRIHEVDNLYVADASFFVSSTAVNPTLTIIANALRVADRIGERLGTPAREAATVA